MMFLVARVSLGMNEANSEDRDCTLTLEGFCYKQLSIKNCSENAKAPAANFNIPPREAP